MKIKSTTLAVIIFIVIFGGIGLTTAVDLWTTTAEKTPTTFKEGEFAGTYDPSDIRGSYSFDKISTLFEVDLLILYEAFGFPDDADGTTVLSKNIEALYENSGVEVGNESMQVFVALYKNLPIELVDTGMPKAAVELIIAGNPALSPEQLEFLKRNEVNVAPESDGITASEAQVESANTTVAETEPLINGASTFQQVLDLGITKDKIEEIIGASMPPTNQTVKDYCSSSGLAFSTIKEQLLELIE